MYKKINPQKYDSILLSTAAISTLSLTGNKKTVLSNNKITQIIKKHKVKKIKYRYINGKVYKDIHLSKIISKSAKGYYKNTKKLIAKKFETITYKHLKHTYALIIFHTNLKLSGWVLIKHLKLKMKLIIGAIKVINASYC